MTLDQVLKLRAEDPAVFNAQVARVAFGFDGKRPPKGSRWHGVNEEGAEYARLPDFARNVAVDFEVLQWIRETWLFSRRKAFADALAEMWAARAHLLNGGVEVWPHRAMRYEPGDYAAAALAASEDR